MIAFNQEWHVEEERPIGGRPLPGEGDATTPAPRRRPPEPSRSEQRAAPRAARSARGPSSRTSLTGRRPRARSSASSAPGRAARAARRLAAPGRASAASASGARITGIRSWIGRIRSFGSQVTIAQLCSDLVAVALRQRGPDPGEREQLAVGAAEPDRPLAALVGAPLVEAVGGDQAAPLAKRLAKRRLALRASRRAR